MNHLAEQEELEIQITADHVEVPYEHFLNHAIQLDKNTYNKIIDDPQARAAFANMTAEERLQQFSPQFQMEIRSLYNYLREVKKATHVLACSVYRIGVLTGSTYQEIAKILEAAFSKQFSKSYISKLYRVGLLLNTAPDLAIVQDAEKLAALSRVPAARLSQMIEKTDEGIVRVANLDIGKATRAQVQKLVEQEVPQARLRSASTRALAAPTSQTSTLDLSALKGQLDSVLPLVVQSGLSDLSDSIVECLRIINENLK